MADDSVLHVRDGLGHSRLIGPLYEGRQVIPPPGFTRAQIAVGKWWDLLGNHPQLPTDLEYARKWLLGQLGRDALGWDMPARKINHFSHGLEVLAFRWLAMRYPHLADYSPGLTPEQVQAALSYAIGGGWAAGRDVLVGFVAEVFRARVEIWDLRWTAGNALKDFTQPVYDEDLRAMLPDTKDFYEQEIRIRRTSDLTLKQATAALEYAWKQGEQRTKMIEAKRRDAEDRKMQSILTKGFGRQIGMPPGWDSPGKKGAGRAEPNEALMGLYSAWFKWTQEHPCEPTERFLEQVAARTIDLSAIWRGLYDAGDRRAVQLTVRDALYDRAFRWLRPQSVGEIRV